MIDMGYSEKILLLMAEDEFSRMVRDTIRKQLEFECDIIDASGGTGALLDTARSKYLVTVLDIDRESCEYENILGDMIDRNVPLIILTECLTDELRDVILTRNIIDYLIKGDKTIAVADKLVSLIGRVHKNRFISILVVDDSSVSRTIIKDALSIQKFVVYEAARSEEAMLILGNNTDIKLCIIDYNMPVLNGLELTTLIRTKYDKEKLAIVGISAYGSNIIASQFLKMGANDFILKPFSKAEFCFRVLQNIEMLEYIEIIKKSATIDFLTGLHNRRYFFEVGEKIFANMKRDNFELTIAMIDIDNFKRINDSFGHSAGDRILLHLASVLTAHFRTADVIARFGGDEFGIVAVNLRKQNAQWKFEKLRKDVEGEEIRLLDQSVRYTISIGVTTIQSDSFDQSIKHSDKLLYRAKESGKNRVCMDS